jgi:hypothetical protein
LKARDKPYLSFYPLYIIWIYGPFKNSQEYIFNSTEFREVGIPGGGDSRYHTDGFYEELIYM